MKSIHKEDFRLKNESTAFPTMKVGYGKSFHNNALSWGDFLRNRDIFDNKKSCQYLKHAIHYAGCLFA